MATELTRQILEDRGYKLDVSLGVALEKEIGDLVITVGSFPFNETRVCIRVEGATIATSAYTIEDLEQLERLFGEGIVDHDDFMYVDDDEASEADGQLGECE